MKSFTEYLTESKKTYAFSIKVAGDVSKDFAEDLRGALGKFSIANLTKGKSSPIQEVQLDFPELKNESVTVYELEIHYPTTPQVLEQYISSVCNCNRSQLRVRGANEHARTLEQEDFKKENSETLLTNSDMGGESAQDKVGEKYISSFLKDLQSASKDRAVKDQPKEKAPEAMPEGTSISPIGSKATKGK